MIVLGIESSCDETACSIVRDGREILSNIVATQFDLHNSLGGVVPELACRRHIDTLLPVVEQALHEANITIEQVDLIAVAQGPGLVGALMIGITAAKALSLSLGIPLVGVSHTEAHLYAAIMADATPPRYPCLGAVLSGGHTTVLQINEIGSYRTIGQTVDDAIGEAFDKAARLLGLPYPGGPAIEKLALKGDAARFSFKAGSVKGRPLDFSFSGIKTAVLYACRDNELTDQVKADIAASFQEAALNDIILKLKRALAETSTDTIVFGGGVTNNRRLRTKLAQALPDCRLIWPPFELTLDNAAMIAGLGYIKFSSNQVDDLTLEAVPTKLLDL